MMSDPELASRTQVMREIMWVDSGARKLQAIVCAELLRRSEKD